MKSITPQELGIEGPNDPYHFQKDVNRVVIDGCDDYRLVMFFLKKGARMPLHDHPNMCVFFKLLFGKLNHRGYDKLDEKFKYNKFSLDEYQELLETKKEIQIKPVSSTEVRENQFLLLRPS